MANPLPPRSAEEFTMLSTQSENLATFTAATTDIITSSSHGLSNGDVITVASGTTLPAGLSASTYYFIIDADTNTFKVSLLIGGSAVDITDTGTGTHTWYQEVVGTVLDVTDFQHLSVSVDVESSPDVTVKCVGSVADSVPTFKDGQLATNPYDFIQVVDQENGNPIDGDTGFAFSADGHRQFRINVDGLTFLTFKTLNFKGGDITIKAKAFRAQ